MIYKDNGIKIEILKIKQYINKEKYIEEKILPI
jgi:hypothetical protein